MSNLREDSLEWFFKQNDIEKADLKEKYFKDVPISFSRQWGYHFTFGQIEQIYKLENKNLLPKQ